MAIGTAATGITLATIFKWIAAGAATAGGATLADWLIDKAKEIDFDKMGENSTLKNLSGGDIKMEATAGADSIPLANLGEKTREHYENELAANNNALKKLEGVDFDKTTNKNNEDKEKDPIPPISGMDSILPGDSSSGQGGIQDTTDLNLGTNNLTPLDWRAWAEEQQRKQWEREDQIRRETQAREDSAWQRGVEDMLKSGINPNLVGAQPAESGGGITQATGVDTSTLTNQMNIDLEEMQQIIDNAFKGNENEKDRFVEIFGKIMSYVGVIMLTKGSKK